MDVSEHSNSESPEKVSEANNSLPLQEQPIGHEMDVNGQDPDSLQNYNSSSDEDYAGSTATSSTDIEEGEAEDEIFEEISDELRVLQGENYMMTRIEVAVDTMKYHYSKLTKVWGAMHYQNKELLGVCKELLLEMKKGTVSGSNNVPPAEVSTGRGKAKVPVECSVSC